MNTDRRTLLALGAALPLLTGTANAAEPSAAAIDLPAAWRTMFAGRPSETFAWWYQGMMFAHVDGLREFPVVGLHAIMICRTTAGTDGSASLDFRTVGFYSDLDSGKPTDSWDNAFTSRRQPIPPFYREGPGRYTMNASANAATIALVSAATRTNRAIVTGETKEGHVTISQVEGTLQGFPRLDGTLPPLGDPLVTERQTRLQFVAPVGAKTAMRGFFNHVYDALPPWLGFGDRLGSGLSKGVMRRTRADEVIDPIAWSYLRHHVADAFAGNRLVLA